MLEATLFAFGVMFASILFATFVVGIAVLLDKYLRK